MSASSIIKPVTTTAQIYGYIRDASLLNPIVKHNKATLLFSFAFSHANAEMKRWIMSWRSARRKGKEGRDWEEHKRIHHKLSEMNTKYEQ